MDILLRGIPKGIKEKIKKMAVRRNLSLNQMMLRIIEDQLEIAEQEEKNKKKWERAFRDVDVIREELREKYGKFDDSAKSIRADRDR